jgi:hypothetical protein
MGKKKHPNYLIDETGNRYGKLTVVSRAENKGTKARWLCQCDCGNEHVIIGTDLRSGHTGSCGCGKATWKKMPVGEGAFNAVFGNYKRSAKRRGILFEISKEDFRELIQRNCYYCNAKPSIPERQNKHNGKFPCNGLDRIDNRGKYTIENVVACCRQCNQAKWVMTEREFYLWVSRVYKHSERRIKEAKMQLRLGI